MSDFDYSFEIYLRDAMQRWFKDLEEGGELLSFGEWLELSERPRT